MTDTPIKPLKKTDLMTEAERDAYHAEKMKKKREARNKILATKTQEKGLLIVHTGKGKGKSTAAFGMVFRALGHGFKVGVVQFVKGVWETGERDVLMLKTHKTAQCCSHCNAPVTHAASKNEGSTVMHRMSRPK